MLKTNFRYLDINNNLRTPTFCFIILCKSTNITLVHILDEWGFQILIINNVIIKKSNSYYEYI